MTEDEKINYPIGGYAPGSYTCACIECKEYFIGDKRAVQCKPCALNLLQESVFKIKEENAKLREALKSLRGLEPWIGDVEMKEHFQKVMKEALSQTE